MNSMMSRLVRLALVGLALLAVIMVTLYLVGGNPRHYTGQIQINAPPDVVFAHLTGPTTAVRWMTRVQRVEPLDEKGFQAGARFRITANDGRRQYEIEEEVLETVANESILLSSSSPAANVRTAYRLSRTGAGQTVVTCSMNVTTKGIRRLWVPLARAASEPPIHADLDQLKSQIESVNEARPPDTLQTTSPPDETRPD
jgi:uncharacterized protein YndB with AHSA1/START domain